MIKASDVDAAGGPSRSLAEKGGVRALLFCAGFFRLINGKMEKINNNRRFKVKVQNKRNGPPGSEQVLSMARPRLHYAIFTLQVSPLT